VNSNKKRRKIMDSKKVFINIIPSFHYDISYLKTCAEYLEMCINNIHQALSILEQYPEYNFTIEQVYLIKEFWNRNPDKRKLFKKFVDEGRLAVSPGMLAVPDMNMPDGESMFMQIKVGKEWLKETLGIDPDVCYIADCWGHHAQLPQIMNQSGYNYYIFWRCMRRDVLLNDFIWQGIDGSQIKTHWLARGYGGISFPAEADKINVLDLDFADYSLENIVSLCKDIQEYGNEGNVLIFNGGDFAYPQISAPVIIEKYKGLSDRYVLNFSTPKKHLSSFDWDDKQVVKGEFNTYEQGTFTTNIRIKQQIRKLVNAMHAMEKLSVFTDKNHSDYTYLWEIILKQQFHDIICGSICDGAVLDAYTEMQLAEKMIKEEQSKLEDFESDAAFFNPLPFERTEIINLYNKKYKVNVKAFGFTKLSELNEIIDDKQKMKLPYVFENIYYKATIGKDGYISSLIEKNSKTDLVGKKKILNGSLIPFGHICMQMDYGDVWLNFEGPISGGSIESSLTQNNKDPYFRGTKNDIINKGTFIPDNISANIIEFSDEELIVEQTGILKFWKISIPVKTKTTFSKLTPAITYETDILPNGKNFRIRAAFPTSVQNGKIRYEIPYGIQEREEAEFPAQNWIDYADRQKGLALFNMGTPANSVDDGIMMLNLFRSVAMEYKTDSFMSYNEGIPHTFKYAVMPHTTNNDVSIIREAYNFTNPLIMTQASDNFINNITTYVTNVDNVIVSGLRWQDKQIFIRVYEACGKEETECSIKLPANITEYTEADGLQQSINDYRPCKGSIRFNIKPFEIKSFLLSTN
jgi:alpha-mannosidase